MRLSDSGWKRRRKTARSIAISVVVLLTFFAFGTAMAASGGEGGAKGWVKTDTYRIINFVILVVALVFVLRKPLSQALNSRVKGIEEQLKDLEAQKSEAEKQLAEYNDKLSRLEEEARKIVDDYIKQGEEAKARILKEAEATAEKMKSQARRNIEHEFEQAKSSLQSEILEKSLVMAEEIIKSKISAEDQDRLVDEYLEKVVAQ
jgi:F-type H+-transporting ATPase subunit b